MVNLGASRPLLAWTLLLAGRALYGQCTLTCPANVVVSNSAGQCGATVNYPAPVASGQCAEIFCNPVTGSFFQLGTTQVLCNDFNGRADCNFTVTVNDTQPPTITCPAAITKSTDPNQCGSVTSYAAPVVSDNCPGVGAPVCAPPSGSFFPKGATTVTCTVADAKGNTGACSSSITVNDTQPPALTVPPHVSGFCPGPISDAALGTASASDNCPGFILTRLNVPPGNVFPNGTTTITYRVTDASGNITTGTQTVSVSTAHTIHGHISTSPPSHSGNVSHQHHGQHGHTVARQACPPHVPGHSAALSPEESQFTPPEPDFVPPIHSDGTRQPARRGEVLSLFGSAARMYLGDQEEWSLAAFTPPANGSTLYYTTRLPEVHIGNLQAEVLFSGLTPGFSGVWQINVRVPADVGTGLNVPFRVQYEGQEAGGSLIVE